MSPPVAAMHLRRLASRGSGSERRADPGQIGRRGGDWRGLGHADADRSGGGEAARDGHQEHSAVHAVSSCFLGSTDGERLSAAAVPGFLAAVCGFRR